MKVKADNGFTLLELVIVIVIIAVLGSLASSNFVKYRANTNLKEAARKISGDIQLCKQRAVAENKSYRIAIDTNNNQYTVQKEISPSVWTNVCPSIRVCDDDTIKIIGHPTYGSNRILFYPRGTTNAGSLKIQHGQVLSEARIVTSLMGRVRIEYALK